MSRNGALLMESLFEAGVPFSAIKPFSQGMPKFNLLSSRKNNKNKQTQTYRNIAYFTRERNVPQKHGLEPTSKKISYMFVYSHFPTSFPYLTPEAVFS